MADRRSPLAQVLYVAFRHSPESTPDLWEAMAIAAREHLSAAPPAAPTERPTCATCPYWHKTRSKQQAWEVDLGQCRHRSSHVTEKQANEWCGDHPAFPAWIASRKADA